MEVIDKIIEDNKARSEGGVEVSIKYIQRDIAEIKLLLDNTYVRREEFDPVKKIVYGLVTLILLAVAGEIINLILKK